MSPASANEAAFQESKRQNTYLLYTQIVEALVHTIGTYQAITIMSLVMEFPNPMLPLSRGPRRSSSDSYPNIHIILQGNELDICYFNKNIIIIQ